MASHWPFLTDFMHDAYMPAAGTALIIPSVGLVIRREDRSNQQNMGARPRDGQQAVPWFLPRGAGSVASFCNGEQTHAKIKYLLDNATKDNRVALFAY